MYRKKVATVETRRYEISVIGRHTSERSTAQRPHTMADPERRAAAAGATIIGSGPEGRTLSSNKVNDKDDDNDAHDELSILSRLTLFRQERHSLRLSASNIAAVAGYHPWKELPQLLFEHIYQSRRGQLLLQQDCDNLSIDLIDQDDDDLALQQLAAKAGVSVQAALDVKNGKRVLHSVDEVQDLKELILKKARLVDAAEMKELTEGVRNAIDTSFGTYHEDDALDQYQRMTGWPVTGRNSETMVWELFDSTGPPSKVYSLPRRQQQSCATWFKHKYKSGRGFRHGHILSRYTAGTRSRE
jgi:hypothetical protein